MEVKKKFNYMNLLLILVFIVGLGILLYPNISDYFNQKNGSKSISEYDETVAEMNEETRKKIREGAISYNETLISNPLGRFSDMSDEQYQAYMDYLNVDGSGMMCYLKIEKLGLNLPVFHGTSEEVLQHYVGHIEGTSLPIGGKGTHCGLSGHRGLPSAVLFTNLDRVEVGDVFSIVVLGEEHYYQVDQIVTVLPTDMSPLAIDPEQDYCTLVTCTPYGENTHRLMVRGVRIDDKEGAEIAKTQDDDEYGLTREQIVNIIAAIMGGVFLFVVLPLLLFPAVPKKVLHLRPWDDNIEEVFKAAIKVSENSTRANWETENVTFEADRLANMRRWDNTLSHADVLSENDESRPWNEYDFYDEFQEMSKEEQEVDRVWDDDVLEKVTQDWSVFDRTKNKINLLFSELTEILQRGKVDAPPEDLNPYFEQEKEIGEEILKNSRKHK